MQGQMNRRWIYAIQKKYIYIYDINIGLLAHGFPVPASWQLEKMCKVSTFEFPCRHCRRQDFFSFHPPHLSGNVYQDFLWIVLPELFQHVDLHSDSVMINAWWCSTTFSSYILGIFEWVSGTMNGRRWTNSMQCSFFLFKSLEVLHL